MTVVVARSRIVGRFGKRLPLSLDPSVDPANQRPETLPIDLGGRFRKRSQGLACAAVPGGRGERVHRFLQTHELVLDPTLGKTAVAMKVEEHLVGPGPAGRDVPGFSLLRQQPSDQAARLLDFKSLGIKLSEPLHTQSQAMPLVGQVGPAQVGAEVVGHTAP